MNEVQHKNVYIFGDLRLLEFDDHKQPILPAKIGEAGFALLLCYMDTFLAKAMEPVPYDKQVKLYMEYNEQIRILEVVYRQEDESGKGDAS